MAVTLDKYGNLRDSVSGKVVGMSRNQGESDESYVARGNANIASKADSWANSSDPIRQAQSKEYGKPQLDIQAEIEKLRKAQTDAAIASLGKARDQSLSNLTAEKATIEPKYQQEKMKTKVNAQQSARSFDEYMAQRGGNRSGIAAQGQLMNNLGYQGAMGELGTAEAGAIADNARRVTDVSNAYNSDVAAAEAGAMATALQNTINQYNQDRAYQQAQDQFNKQFGLSEAGITGVYNGQSTMAAQQAALAKALQEAGLTGMYNGQATLPYQQYQTGIDQWNKQFESNNAQQAFENKLAEQQLALSQAKAASGGSSGGGSYKAPTATQIKNNATAEAYNTIQSWIDAGYDYSQIRNNILSHSGEFAQYGLDPQSLADDAYNMYQSTRFNSGGHAAM